MQPTVARLNHRFGLALAVLLPATLGLGCILLFLWRRSFVHKVDESGVYLWSGTFVPWSEVNSIMTRKGYRDAERPVLRLDLIFADGRGVVLPRWLENGAELIEAIRAGMRAWSPSKGAVRVQYVQRRQ